VVSSPFLFASRTPGTERGVRNPEDPCSLSFSGFLCYLTIIVSRAAPIGPVMRGQTLFSGFFLLLRRRSRSCFGVSSPCCRKDVCRFAMELISLIVLNIDAHGDVFLVVPLHFTFHPSSPPRGLLSEFFLVQFPSVKGVFILFSFLSRLLPFYRGPTSYGRFRTYFLHPARISDMFFVSSVLVFLGLFVIVGWRVLFRKHGGGGVCLPLPSRLGFFYPCPMYRELLFLEGFSPLLFLVEWFPKLALRFFSSDLLLPAEIAPLIFAALVGTWVFHDGFLLLSFVRSLFARGGPSPHLPIRSRFLISSFEILPDSSATK